VERKSSEPELEIEWGKNSAGSERKKTSGLLLMKQQLHHHHYTFAAEHY
jgi:hypothetical protein